MPKPPIEFNRIESDSGVAASVAGSGYSITGSPAYAAGKYGNGINVPANNSGLVVCTSYLGDILKTQGTIELWYKPVYASTDGTLRFITGGYGTPGPTGVTLHYIYWRDGKFYFQTAKNHLHQTATAVSFSAGEWIHLAGVWDDAGINGGANRTQLYVNGVLKGYYSGAIVIVGAEWNGIMNIVGFSHTTASGYGVNDNIKVYDYAKTDFSDRFNERGGMNDQ